MSHQKYLLARLKRDAPEICAAMERGEFWSARAAAKAAGILREPTPLATLHRVWRKVSLEDRARFLIEMLTPAERRPTRRSALPVAPGERGKEGTHHLMGFGENRTAAGDQGQLVREVVPLDRLLPGGMVLPELGRQSLKALLQRCIHGMHAVGHPDPP